MHESDQLRATIELAKESGKFEFDESGYLKFVPSDEEQKLIESWLAEEIALAKELHKPIFAEAAENIETYKAVKFTIPESGESILPSPIARNPADQIIASTVNKVARARPMVSLDPYFPGKFQVPVPQEMPAINPETGQPEIGPDGMPVMQTAALVIERSAEDIAFGFTQGMEFKNRERLEFIKCFHRTVHDCVTGASPTWWKVYREKRTRPLITPKVKGAFLDLADSEEKHVRYGEDVNWCNVPYCNVLRPNLDDEIDDLPWLSELDPKTPSQITAGFHNKEYFLIKDEKEAEALSANVTETTPDTKAQTDSTTRNITPTQPKAMCDVHEVWFYRNLRVIDPDDETKTVVRRFSLMGAFHLGAKRLLSCYRNPYDHQRRIHVPFTQFLDGSSTVGIVKYNQRVGTHLTQAEIKNGYHANNFSYWYDPNGDSAEFFKSRKKIAPGEFIPGKFGEDWGVVRAGEGFTYSLLPMIQWNAGQGQEASKVSAYESGQSIPGRTPSSTVQQILERGGEPGNLFMLRLNEGVQKVMRLYLETARQYSPMGETVPVKHPETEAILEVPFRFPIGDVMDNFRISLTAADEMLSKEHAPEEIAMMMQLYQSRSQFVASIAGPLMDTRATPATMDFFAKIIEGDQVIFDKLMSVVRTDTKEKFDLMPAVDALIREKQEMMRQMPPEAEAGNVTDQAQTGGAVPGAEGADLASGPSGVGGEPGVSPDALPPPAESAEAPFVQ